MQASEFLRKWGPGGPAHELTERAGAQAHFIDLCRLLSVPEPDDPERYCFERGVTKTGSAAGRTDGFADVWLKGCFAWEYKRTAHSALDTAVAAAYGWADCTPAMPDDEILRRLLALNHERSGAAR